MEETRMNSEYVVAAELQALKLMTELSIEETTEAISDIFPHASARAIRDAIYLLKTNEESITEGSLLREANKISDDVDIGVIRNVLDCVADRSNWQGAIKSLREGSVKYNIDKILKPIIEKMSADDDIDHAEISSALYEAQDALIRGGKKTKVKTLEECLHDYKLEMEQRRIGKLYEIGDIFLDKALTRKFAPGQVITIAGTTGMGKSGYALNLINGLINLDVPCLYFSLEMDEYATMDRLLAMRTGIPIDDWYQSRNIPSLVKKVEQQERELANKRFGFIDDPNLSLGQIQSIIRTFKMQHRCEYAIVFIDLITQVSDFSSQKGGNLANTIEFAINRESAISKTENCCMVNVVQLNRETDGAKIGSIEEIESFRPSLTQIKNSNALGERSRTVLAVFRPKYYAERLFPDASELEYMEDIMEVQILKQSQGAVGMRGMYLFEGPTTSLKPYVPTEGDLPRPTDGDENG